MDQVDRSQRSPDVPSSKYLSIDEEWDRLSDAQRFGGLREAHLNVFFLAQRQAKKLGRKLPHVTDTEIFQHARTAAIQEHIPPESAESFLVCYAKTLSDLRARALRAKYGRRLSQ